MWFAPRLRVVWQVASVLVVEWMAVWAHVYVCWVRQRCGYFGFVVWVVGASVGMASGFWVLGGFGVDPCVCVCVVLVCVCVWCGQMV